MKWHLIGIAKRNKRLFPHENIICFSYQGLKIKEVVSSEIACSWLICAFFVCCWSLQKCTMAPNFTQPYQECFYNDSVLWERKLSLWEVAWCSSSRSSPTPKKVNLELCWFSLWIIFCTLRSRRWADMRFATIQIWPKSRGLGCVTSAPAADENRDAGFTRFRVDAHNIKAICVHWN